MAARVIDGKAVAAAVRERVRGEVAAYEAEAGRSPTLATVIVGDDPASEIYVANKHRACEEAGMGSVHHGLAADTSEAELLRLVAALGADEEVDGILVQLPVPGQIDPDAIVAAIDPGKDVDGLTPLNAGLLAHGTPGLVPCTPAGVMELLAHEGVELEGAETVVVGRSKLVGVPVARLLLAADATVTVCHSRSRDLPATCRRADVLVAAVGVPELLGANAIKPGAVVIDVGVNRTEDGLRGDVDFAAAAEIAAAITPVPGGVGPMTIAMLLVNALQAARARRLSGPA
jgi:methylenetetrahydrofolate dehydrogenase (NADP+) / methenyltetrahydrofolate cyclohydrolase